MFRQWLASRQSPSSRRFFGQKSQPTLDALPRAAAERLALEQDLASLERIESEKNPRQLRTAGAHQSGNAKHLAAEGETNVVDNSWLGHAFELEAAFLETKARLSGPETAG